MTWKVGTPVVVFLAGALLSRTINFDSPHDRAETVRTAAVTTQAVAAKVEGVRVFEIAQPPARESRRNLFAFTEDPRPSRPQVVLATMPKSTELPHVDERPEIPKPREPEFPMRFIGTFGMAKDPIAVFASNGEVVNAKVGDRVTGEFRLASIGLESVEVSTPRGATQRVALVRDVSR